MKCKKIATLKGGLSGGQRPGGSVNNGSRSATVECFRGSISGLVQRNTGNPLFCASAFDALRRLTDALPLFVNHGPGTQEPIPCSDRCSLDGLIDVLRRETHTLHDYFTALGEFTTFTLPLTDADLKALHVKHAKEVKEPAAVYAIK